MVLLVRLKILPISTCRSGYNKPEVLLVSKLHLTPLKSRSVPNALCASQLCLGSIFKFIRDSSRSCLRNTPGGSTHVARNPFLAALFALQLGTAVFVDVHRIDPRAVLVEQTSRDDFQGVARIIKGPVRSPTSVAMVNVAL